MKTQNLLVNAPLMFSRRVADLHRTKQAIAALHHWPVVRSEQNCVVYKAGAALLAFYSDKNLSALSTGNPSLVHNAASSIVIGVPAVSKIINTLAKGKHITADHAYSLSSNGTFSYVDDYGNSTVYQQNHRSAGKPGRNSLPARSTAYNKGQSPHRLVAVDLLVSDLHRSTLFYRDILGLKLVQSTADHAVLQASMLTLMLNVEPVCGLVASLNRSQRLLGDRITFAVMHMDRVVQKLLAHGIIQSAAVEKSLMGKELVISDPDGRLIALWEPQNHVRGIQYSKNLSRQFVTQFSGAV